jgi:hypothetical protein
MSQPLVYSEKETPIERTYSLQDSNKKLRREGISIPERDIKIQELENYIKSNIGISDSNVNNGDQTVEEVVIQENTGKIAKFFYFIGRLNPPHKGHIKALMLLVKMANDEGSIPLILLGSGPGGVRTLDNPISFELKENFIRRLLNENLPGSRFIIQRMSNTAQNVSDYIIQGLTGGTSSSDLINIRNIEIKHIAGGKEQDETKLLFALKAAEKSAKQIVPEADILASVKSVDAETTDGETAMSATKVRKDAYRSQLDGSGFGSWVTKYGDFYGQDAEEMYNQIIFPLQEYEEKEEKDKIIQNYLDGIVVSEKKVGKKGKRGGKKRKSNKNKTLKRKRRLTRRKNK